MMSKTRRRVKIIGQGGATFRCCDWGHCDVRSWPVGFSNLKKICPEILFSKGGGCTLPESLPAQVVLLRRLHGVTRAVITFKLTNEKYPKRPQEWPSLTIVWTSKEMIPKNPRLEKLLLV